MTQGKIAEAGTYSLIHKSLICLTALCLVCLGTLGARGLLLHSQYVQAVGETKAAKLSIEEAREMVAKGAGLNPSSNEAGLSAVSAFQTVLVERARANDCLVREVSTSSETQPYNSRFKKDTPESEFIQLRFKAVIVGTPAALVATLDSLAKAPIPFEYDTITIRRDKVQGSETTVEASIDLRVLTKAGGA